MKTYIALDIETTGFDASLDQVIEIAAIKFEGSKILESFETLVNPQVPVPEMITHITGIKEEDLTDSPRFEQIQEKLAQFLGNHPIIGHNISFDVTFLNSKGLRLTNPLYDTLQLATILLPGLASYSLDTLGRTLKIEHEHKHRAMSDTKASYELFLILEEKMKEIDASTYEQIQSILNKSTWSLRELFFEAKKSANTPVSSIQNLPHMPGTLEQPVGIFSEEQLIEFYKPQGPFAAIMKDYEARPTQNQLTAKILESFKTNRSLIAEAGTGTGKTLAYLLASLYWSLNEDQKIIISTYTHNLQEQIVHKDVPLLQAALQEIDKNISFKVACLKGRKNYLSLKRLELFQEKHFFEDHEVTVLIKILLWLPKTKTGDLQELSLQNKEFTVLDEICCAEHICSHENPEFKNNCYLQKARQKAEKGNILIVNHALLLQDALGETPLLPESSYIIIDEAHHLEKVTTESLCISISFNSFLRPFERILRVIDEVGGKNKNDDFRKLKTATDQLISRIEIFFGLVGIFMEKNLDPNRFQYQLNLKKTHFNTLDWQKVKDSGGGILAKGKEIVQAITKLQQKIDLEEKHSKELKNHLYECEKCIMDLEKLLRSEENKDRISWVLKSIEGSITLKSAPLNIGSQLHQLLFDQKKSVVLTSATLRTDSSFTFIRQQLQLGQQFDEIALPSHFSYPDQVRVLIPEEFPEPATEGYFLSCAELIENIIKKNGGRTLVLFTSKKALTATYHLIAPKLKEEGFTVLAQHMSGGRGKIIEHFKDEPQSCAIFGNDSFWEGVDIKGGSLTCVVMQKLPFDPPDDPIIQARSHTYLNSFEEFQLPRAILKFKQGFGRLIRSSKDTGSIVLLDSRITQKAYGQRFIQSLPAGIKIEYRPKETLADLLYKAVPLQ